MSTVDTSMDKLTVTEVAEILEVNEESVRRWIREGKLSADKKLGRTGHTIYLNALVDFANKSSTVYQNKLKTWMKKENIPFEFTKASSGIPAAAAAAGTASLVAGPVGAIAAGFVGYMLGSTPSKITLKNTVEADTNASNSIEKLTAPADEAQIQVELDCESLEAAGTMVEEDQNMDTQNPHNPNAEICELETDGAANSAQPAMDTDKIYDDLMKEALCERLRSKQEEISALQEKIEALQMELKKLNVRLAIAGREAEICESELNLL